MGQYYSEKLNAANLYRVYQSEIAGIDRYLNSEIAYVRDRLPPAAAVLELGAGYGRIMKELAPAARRIDGIDLSEESVALGEEYLSGLPNCRLRVADAYRFHSPGKYDAVLCLQNGLSAFGGDPDRLVSIAMKLLQKGGRAFFSTYSHRFWEVRLEWFREQAAKGLLGEIDEARTGDGTIVCRDGFVATTFSPEELERLGRDSGHPHTVEEVDGSSLFLVIGKERE